MSKQTYWKDIRQSFSRSKGRAVSIISLMALGSFAYVGLKVTPPNIRVTGQDFFAQHQTADLYVLSNYGLTEQDANDITKSEDRATVEFGYFQDVAIADSTTALRLFSAPETVSTYELVAGRLPSESSELALANRYRDRYQLGETLTVVEKENARGERVLKEQTFTIVGFVNSSEILSSVNQGPSTAGSGELQGYAIIPKETFDSDVYMMARLSYDRLRGTAPYDQAYLDAVQTEKESLEDRLADLPDRRLNELKSNTQAQLVEGRRQIAEAKADLARAEQELAAATTQLAEQEAQLAEPAAQLDQLKALGIDPASDPQLASVQTALQQLAAAKQHLADQQQDFDEQKGQVQSELAEKEAELTQVEDQLDQLAHPTYTVYTRREVPGSEGYLSYENNAAIIDQVSNIFPVVLYFVAALVTANTMTRFVDEERLKSGTLRALGYDRHEVSRKFLIYGAVTSVLGTVIGTVAGHLLLPITVYQTYAGKLTLPPIQLQYYPVISLVALGLGLTAALLPAYLVAKRELAEKPAQLLKPKPPAAGSTILLERVTLIWKRLTFTQKVTARNIFRYKQRMLMTIFGVAGSVALLFAGLGMRQSIDDLSKRQFRDIITYDMIVADKEVLTKEEEVEKRQFLSSSAIAKHLPIHYEGVTQNAGAKGDLQDITLLAVGEADATALSDYLRLKDRVSGQAMSVDVTGAILSEKLATLLGAEVGGQVVVKDSAGREVILEVAGVTEIYMGHFILLSQASYEAAFGQKMTANATLVTLKNAAQTNQVATDAMALASTKGVVQNTSLKNQVAAIVDGLGSIMYVLIAASVLLALVILYNLTNINVAERLRELSTIKVLGFFDKEVTLYIYRETIYLSLFGIGLGFVLGNVLAQYMLTIIPPDAVMFNPDLPWLVYAVPAGLILLILALLGLLVNHWLKRVDMLEALKSVE